MPTFSEKFVEVVLNWISVIKQYSQQYGGLIKVGVVAATVALALFLFPMMKVTVLAVVACVSGALLFLCWRLIKASRISSFWLAPATILFTLSIWNLIPIISLLTAIAGIAGVAYFIWNRRRKRLLESVDA